MDVTKSNDTSSSTSFSFVTTQLARFWSKLEEVQQNINMKRKQKLSIAADKYKQRANCLGFVFFFWKIF